MQGLQTNLTTYYPDLEQCLEEADEAFGLVILEILKEFTRVGQETKMVTTLSKHVITNQWVMKSAVNAYILKTRFEEKVEDAWRWLHESKLIKPQTGMNGQHGLVMVTELGWNTARDQKTLLDASRALPENLVHPRILARIKSDFRDGLYDKAVQDAFKQVETEARRAAKLDKVVSGEDVFKRAFQKGSQLYEHVNRPNDIRELFCVAYRMHRHSPSHDNTVIAPLTAARILVLASHLLFQLDEICAKANSGP